MQLAFFPPSTTSRPVVWFLAFHRIPYEAEIIDLMAGEHRRDPYLSRNPAGAVPLLDDDGFVLTESKAILRYLGTKYASSWYPAGLQERARVDEAMDYVHAWLYTYLGLFFAYPQAFPPTHGFQSEVAWEEVLARGRREATRHLEVLESRYLAEGREWLAGGAGPSLADAVASSVLSLAEVVQVDYTPYPRLQQWFERVKALPHWQQANAPVYGLAQMFADKTFASLVV